jgi:hypothetical protein
MVNTQKQFREYLIENIRINKTLFNELNNGDWEELGYSSEEDMESICSRYGGAFNALECVLEHFDNIKNKYEDVVTIENKTYVWNGNTYDIIQN